MAAVLSQGHTEPLWNVKQVAAFLNVSQSWIYQSAGAGTIPCVRLGQALRFVPEAIRAWIDGQHGGIVVRLPSCR